MHTSTVSCAYVFFLPGFARPTRVLITTPSRSTLRTATPDNGHRLGKDEQIEDEAQWQDEPDSTSNTQQELSGLTLLGSPTSRTKRRRYAMGSPATASSISRSSISSCSSAIKVTGMGNAPQGMSMTSHSSSAMTFASPLREMRGPHRHRRTPGALQRQGSFKGEDSPRSSYAPRAPLPTVHIRPPSTSTSVPMEHHF